MLLRSAAVARHALRVRPAALTAVWVPASARPFAAAAAGPSAALVKQLREATGAPMMECRNALIAEGVNLDVEKAIDWLRKKGLAAASKKAGRVAAQGLVAAAVHPSGHAGVLVEVNCETDFVARNDLFKEVAARTAATAAGTLAPAAAGALSSPLLQAAAGSAPSPCGPAVVEAGDVAALGGLQLAGAGDAAVAGASVASSLTDLIAKIRENMVLRRVGGLTVAPPPAPAGAPADAAFAHVASYTHNPAGPGLGSIGVLLGVRGAAATSAAAAAAKPAVAELARKVAMHVAAQKPSFRSKAEVPAAALDRERDVLRTVAAASGKPEAIVARMVEGRLSKYYAESCLLEQPYILSEEGASVAKVVDKARKDLGLASLEVTGFLRFVVGQTAAPAEGEAAAAEGEALAKTA